MMTPDSCVMWMRIFCGVHGHDPQDEPSSPCSQSGHPFSYHGCPILEKIPLQTKITLSTFHAKYITLSSAFCQLIIFQCILQDLVNSLGLDDTQTLVIHAVIFEDNNSTLSLATNQHLMDFSKWLNMKHHHFW